MSTPIQYPKDTTAYLDYKFDWEAWLEADETITEFQETVPDGLTFDDDNSGITDSGKSVTFWLSGGDANEEYKVRCTVTTSSTPPRVDTRTMVIRAANR